MAIVHAIRSADTRFAAAFGCVRQFFDMDPAGKNHRFSSDLSHWTGVNFLRSGSESALVEVVYWATGLL
mgnify:CR=1 FL=1